jgi:hypothetical protein
MPALPLVAAQAPPGACPSQVAMDRPKVAHPAPRSRAVPMLASLLMIATAIPAAPTATLQFVDKDMPLAGISYGIDFIDGNRNAFGQRVSTAVPAGTRTVWYTCPGEAPMSSGSRLSFDFKAGERYELVCRTGQDALIRRADNC